MNRETKVEITDLESNDGETFYLTDSDDSYIVLCGSALDITNVQMYANGTKVITIKKVDNDGS